MVGRTLGHYRVLEQIGAGGMGIVYRAHDERLERDVALKVLPPGTLAEEAVRRRFRKEALTLSQLNHPNIASVYDFDTQDGVDFLVMELIQGETLGEKLAAGALGEKEISRLGTQLAQGLAAAHEQGVVHRDLKPGNLRLTSDGRLKILDFGLATLRRPERADASTVSMTETRGLAGTLPYMAPEQLRGEKADARSDIFSAGVVLYEMATGRRPFAQPADTLLNPPPAPSAANKKVSAGLEGIILKALDKEPERRYQSSREVAVDLERLTAPVAVSAPRRRLRWWWAAAAALALSLAAVGLYLSRRPALESIAVLPFVNASGSSDAEYLSDGMAETLINSLSKLPGLKVTSRSLAFRYKGKEVDPRAVGRELSVQAVLLGRLAQRGEQLSLSAELVDVRDGNHIWGEQYNRKLADVLALQEELGREISGQLRLRLSGEQEKALAKRPTQNPEAYQEYLKGRYFVTQQTAPNLRLALAHFQRAIDKDPAYALAYSGLAEYYRNLGLFGPVPPRESLPKLHAAASRALQLDDTLPEAHTALAAYKTVGEWDWAGAEREYRRALELNPGDAMGHYMYALFFLTGIGRVEEAARELKRALDLDPVSLIFSNGLAAIYYYAREYDQAIEQFLKNLAMDPNNGRTRSVLGEVYVQKSLHTEGIAELKRAVDLTQGGSAAISALGHAYARSGDRAAARKVLDQILSERSRGYFPAFRIALVHVGLGEKDRAFEWLDKAVEERDSWLIYLKAKPDFDPLRSDPRYAALLRRINLAP